MMNRVVESRLSNIRERLVDWCSARRRAWSLGCTKSEQWWWYRAFDTCSPSKCMFRQLEIGQYVKMCSLCGSSDFSRNAYSSKHMRSICSKTLDLERGLEANIQNETSFLSNKGVQLNSIVTSSRASEVF